MVTGKAMPVKELTAVRKVPPMPSNPRSLDVGIIESRLNHAWLEDQVAHEENRAAIENNVMVRAKITELMKAAGVPDTYQAKKPSRSIYTKWEKRDAGYLGDLARNFPITDQFAQVQALYESKLKAVTAAREKLEAEKATAKTERDHAAARRKADLKLAAIVVRHGMPEDTDWRDALEILRRKCKYMDLAIAGQQTRGDWSEGGWRVDAALKRFTIEDNRDKDIAADLMGCLRAMNEGDTDGRTFRDTEWSYDKLFALVDAALLADARVCLENIHDRADDQQSSAGDREQVACEAGQAAAVGWP